MQSHEQVSKQKIMKRVLQWAGGTLALAGVGFVIIRLSKYSSQIDLGCFGFSDWLIITVLAVIYGLSSFMLAFAWRNLLEHHGVKSDRQTAVRIYGISQLARYVPGNIFHLAGRQAMGLAKGLPNWPLAKSSVWELGLISATGAIYGILAVPLLISSIPIEFAVVFFICVLSLALAGVRHYLDIPTMRAVLYYAIFLCISGFIFVGALGVVTSGGGIKGWQLLSVSGAYVFAWLAGLLTPGAPAGMGVRELVVLMLLGNIVDDADLLLAVVLSRIIIVCGDVIFFGAASFIRKRQNHSGNN